MVYSKQVEDDNLSYNPLCLDGLIPVAEDSAISHPERFPRRILGPDEKQEDLEPRIVFRGCFKPEQAKAMLSGDGSLLPVIGNCEHLCQRERYNPLARGNHERIGI